MSAAQKSLLGSNDQLPILAAMEAAMKENGGTGNKNDSVALNTHQTLENTNRDVLNSNGAVLNPNGEVSDFRDRELPMLSSINGNVYISPYEAAGYISSTGSSILESVAVDLAPGKAQYRGPATEIAQGSHFPAVG